MKRIIIIMAAALSIAAVSCTKVSVAEKGVGSLSINMTISQQTKAMSQEELLASASVKIYKVGYGPLGNVTVFGMQFLDFFDFITNSVMMPIAAFCICLFIRRRMTLAAAVEEVLQEGHSFRRRAVFEFMIQYVCPVFVILILVSSLANVLGFISM